jgi:hypothetical protein
MDHVENRGNMFAKPLLGNDSCIIAYLMVVAQQQVYMLQYILYTGRFSNLCP